MKYIILVLWTFSVFLLMFSAFPFRVECRPSRAGSGPGPPCPFKSAPWASPGPKDISVKAWQSPLVLQGTARSRSDVRSDHTFGVTFDLHRVVKGSAPVLYKRKQFRLQFLNTSSLIRSDTSSNGGRVFSASSNANGRSKQKMSLSKSLVEPGSRADFSRRLHKSVVPVGTNDNKVR